MKDRWLRNIVESVLNPKNKERAEKETAIATWENDPERNAEKLKVVRGSDGLPVEIVMKSQSEAAFVVNGQERPFVIAGLLGGSFDDPIPSLCLDGLLQEGYQVKAIQRIHYGDKRKPLDVLKGTSTGMPSGLVVTQ